MAAEEQRDDLKACPLQWMYCHVMLLTGSRPEHVITVSAFLAHVKEFKEAIKSDPAFANTELLAFTKQKIKEELVYIKCHQCVELNDKLQACLGCGKAKYCSKDCQKKHWVSRHKKECTAGASEGRFV
ncbi:hypothetical protein COCSUDRAFT_55127 [Coccomyxa subellipsoidea C-169]|uniref:MYND-type domain-containing protein n=1 Tax=Coccomyxa subellipsoidea (strain C-169) TaxID=574566 RepID=I0Z8Y5_COCSC|nr:hypothetical protein COCSUDRAFT_55127 [Coccomyxa subellipsoidea C-169]EIE27104.1 hypothetical protein COCSUDRAFT_55127 [Coccomyxa subellipsoidea C-169]|eukprot:XP_005651648.1 hypothetical protein COCSUDRAFT_55127 [Coccomyxa subellipsoidea C-169]